jgi:adenosylcobyric acid synthase
VFENDEFRREFLRRLAASTGRRFTPAPDVSFAQLRQDRLDRLGDLVAEHLDTDALLRLIEKGAPPQLPVVTATLG